MQLAERAGATVTPLRQEAGFPVIAIEKPRQNGGEDYYLSAGIHGDEPAGAWGLLAWAGKHLRESRDGFLILPCLNPGGLADNTRHTREGYDLNRAFQDPWPPLLDDWRTLVTGRRFRVAVCLHEDYDGRGVYCYEICRSGRMGAGAAAIAAAARVIPVDPGSVIDGRRAQNGLLRRTRVPDLDGTPEAFSLFLEHTKCSLTFETPSEFSLYQRIMAHEAFLDGVVGE